jgi:hypothetical protein
MAALRALPGCFMRPNLAAFMRPNPAASCALTGCFMRPDRLLHAPRPAALRALPWLLMRPNLAALRPNLAALCASLAVLCALTGHFISSTRLLYAPTSAVVCACPGCPMRLIAASYSLFGCSSRPHWLLMRLHWACWASLLAASCAVLCLQYALSQPPLLRLTCSPYLIMADACA